METEADIIESLTALGYAGKCLEKDVLNEALLAGPKSAEFRGLVIWITYEIHIIRKTDESVHKDAEENGFLLELFALLKELSCPYKQFIIGPVTNRIQTKESRILLLDFLLTELMASKMCKKSEIQHGRNIIMTVESDTALALKIITQELSLGKPPEYISPKVLFDKISNRLDEQIKRVNPKKLSQPLFKINKNLTAIQWKALENLQKDFENEYNIRKEMLLTRLDVTVQSFQWSEKMKGKEKQIIQCYEKKKAQLDSLKNCGFYTDIPALLVARSDLAIIEKTSSANVRKNTSSKVQKHIIGRVPDRGGRAYEHAPPPPEMPSWQQNRATPQGSRGGMGNRGGGRGSGEHNRSNQYSGGRFQGNSNISGFNQRQQYEQKQPYNQRSSYDQRQYEQKSQYDIQYSRVQGGWSQRGNDRGGYKQNERTNNYMSGDGNRNNASYQNNEYQDYGNAYNSNKQNYGNTRGFDNNNRGRSNYKRGGGGRR